MVTINAAKAQSVSTAKYTGLVSDTVASDFIYPTGLGNNGQDFIKFTAFSYKAGGFTPAGSSGLTTLGTGGGTGSPIGSVILPIQSGINDSNMVSWGQDELNQIDAAKAGTAYNSIMQGSGEEGIGSAITSALTNIMEDATAAAKLSASYKKEIAIYFAGRAANVNNLLSRAEGKVVNPNMELLFQGPALRPFTFAFRLFPRDSSEATTVKNIIQFFKKNMAPNLDGAKGTELFLNAPNIFKIEFVNGRDKSIHGSLPLIKDCALQTCSVDYTPDGQYMTFNDDNSTMTSFGLSLQFTELQPVYGTDYANVKSGAIGF